jgi:hypothetical protein
MANSFGSRPFFNQFMVQVLVNTMVMRLQWEFSWVCAGVHLSSDHHFGMLAVDVIWPIQKGLTV